MADVVNILRSYFPARLLIRRAPSVRRDLKHGVRIPMLQPVGLADFLSLEVPPRAMLLAPILSERSLSSFTRPEAPARAGSASR